MRSTKPSLTAISSDWEELADCGAFTTHMGPIFRLNVPPTDDEPYRIGFEVLPIHCNRNGVSHGGMLTCVLDIALGRAAEIGLRREGHTSTISMTVDFLAPVFLGERIESRTQLLRGTHRTGFLQSLLVGPSGPVVRGSGIFKMPPPFEASPAGP